MLMSPAAMGGLTALVKHSSSATSRRFGGKVLYLLPTLLGHILWFVGRSCTSSPCRPR